MILCRISQVFSPSRKLAYSSKWAISASEKLLRSLQDHWENRLKEIEDQENERLDQAEELAKRELEKRRKLIVGSAAGVKGDEEGRVNIEEDVKQTEQELAMSEYLLDIQRLQQCLQLERHRQETVLNKKIFSRVQAKQRQLLQEAAENKKRIQSQRIQQQLLLVQQHLQPQQFLFPRPQTKKVRILSQGCSVVFRMTLAQPGTAYHFSDGQHAQLHQSIFPGSSSH